MSLKEVVMSTERGSRDRRERYRHESDDRNHNRNNDNRPYNHSHNPTPKNHSRKRKFSALKDSFDANDGAFESLADLESPVAEWKLRKINKNLPIFHTRIKKLYVINGLARSGNHLFISWLLSGISDSNIVYFNNLKTFEMCRMDAMMQRLYHRKQAIKKFKPEIVSNLARRDFVESVLQSRDTTAELDTVIITSENKDRRHINLVSSLFTNVKQVYRVMVVRDLFNLLATRLESEGGHVFRGMQARGRTRETELGLTHNLGKVHLYTTDRITVTYWLDNIKAIDDAQQFIVFNYNRFVNNEEIRNQLAEQLDICGDKAFLTTNRFGLTGGSSFFRDSGYFVRYRGYLDHKLVRETLKTDRLVRLVNDKFDLAPDLTAVTTQNEVESKEDDSIENEENGTPPAKRRRLNGGSVKEMPTLEGGPRTDDISAEGKLPLPPKLESIRQRLNECFEPIKNNCVSLDSAAICDTLASYLPSIDSADNNSSFVDTVVNAIGINTASAMTVDRNSYDMSGDIAKMPSQSELSSNYILTPRIEGLPYLCVAVAAYLVFIPMPIPMNNSQHYSKRQSNHKWLRLRSAEISGRLKSVFSEGNSVDELTIAVGTFTLPDCDVDNADSNSESQLTYVLHDCIGYCGKTHTNYFPNRRSFLRKILADYKKKIINGNVAMPFSVMESPIKKGSEMSAALQNLNNRNMDLTTRLSVAGLWLYKRVAPPLCVAGDENILAIDIVTVKKEEKSGVAEISGKEIKSESEL